MAQTKIIYGLHAVNAALQRHPENVLTVYCVDKADKMFADCVGQADNFGIFVQYCKPLALDKIANSTHHQGIAAQIRQKEILDQKAIERYLENPPTVPLILILEGLQDPHNLGACLRSAEALGVDWVVMPKNKTAPLNATVSKVACGADQYLAIAEVPNIVRFIQQIQSQGVWVVGTSDKASITIQSASLTRPLALVMGPEGEGLKRLTLEVCDEVVKIPLRGSTSSLNVSVATGICLYECLRMRSQD